MPPPNRTTGSRPARPRSTAALACLLALGALAIPARGDVRADFLALIDRPKAPLAPEERREQEGEARCIHFSYTSEAAQRVPGILYEQPTDGRRPAVIVLHGTGGKKEGEAKFLKRLAAAGYAAVSIDARYHGERGTMKDYSAAI